MSSKLSRRRFVYISGVAAAATAATACGGAATPVEPTAAPRPAATTAPAAPAATPAPAAPEKVQ